MTAQQPILTWMEDRWAYLSLVLSLAIPAIKPHVFEEESLPTAAPLTDWEPDELMLLIDEGRRQLDRQDRRLDGLRTRAQLSFTTALALVAALVNIAGPVEIRPPAMADILLVLGFVTAIYSALGAAGLLVVRATMGTVDTAQLARRSKNDGPILKQLALEYSANVRPGEATLATRLTVFFEVAVWLLLSAACTALLYAIY